MIELDRAEAIRYMGYHGTQPDEAVQASLTRCGEALQQAAEPKSIYRVFPLQHIDAQTIEIADVQIHSKNLARNLQGCSEVCLMAATLGIGPDRLIARASAVRMSDAVIYQAAAAAMVLMPSRPSAARATPNAASDPPQVRNVLALTPATPEPSAM